MLELLVGTVLLAVLVVPLVGLLSGQDRQVSWANRETALAAHGFERLQEEEARLAIAGFEEAEAPEREMRLQTPAGALDLTERVSVEAGGVAGLWKLTIEIAGGGRAVRLERLVVDRALAAPLPEPGDDEQDADGGDEADGEDGGEEGRA
jgi:hypothetical protein